MSKAGNALCQAIPGNIIPANQLSPNGLAILNAYPAPTPGFQAAPRIGMAQAAQPINQRKDIWNLDIIPKQQQPYRAPTSDLAYNEYDPFDQGRAKRPNTLTVRIRPTRWLDMDDQSDHGQRTARQL